MKEHWVIPNADSVTVKPNKKDVYPVNLLCHGHDTIEEIEIPNDTYIKIKIKGRWNKIYLPHGDSIE
jgi:effector-binding domain-containing protein